jgi:GNAT superfamily N-acetyltransferase
MNVIIRPAHDADAQALLPLVEHFATSFAIDRQAFVGSFGELIQTPHAHLIVAEAGEQLVGYLLGFEHLTFYANGRVAWVEELMVEGEHRRQGIGQSLMRAFEAWAAGAARLVALATRRAASFYTALGYQESATYFRRLL